MRKPAATGAVPTRQGNWLGGPSAHMGMLKVGPVNPR